MPVLSLIQIFGEAASHGAEEATGLAALGLDPYAVLAQAGTFLLLFWIVKKFALEKIVKTLEERRKTIDQGVRLGYQMTEEKAKLTEKIEDELRKTREQADRILADAHKEAGEAIKAAEATASRKVDAMLAEAHVKIEDDMKRARKALEKDIRNLVADATEVIIDEKLDAQKDQGLIERALSGVRR